MVILVEKISHKTLKVECYGVFKKLMCGPQIYKIDVGGAIKIYLEDIKLFTKHFIKTTCYSMLNNLVPQILYIMKINVNENS